MRFVITFIIMNVMMIFTNNPMSAADIPTPDFAEYTQEFFSTPRSYFVKRWSLRDLSMIKDYEKDEFKFIVTNNGFKYQFPDSDKLSEYTIQGKQTENLEVYTGSGSVRMPMLRYNFNGFDNAIRAIKFNNGDITLYTYTFNTKVQKYVMIEMYMLYH